MVRSTEKMAALDYTELGRSAWVSRRLTLTARVESRLVSARSGQGQSRWELIQRDRHGQYAGPRGLEKQ